MLMRSPEIRREADSVLPASSVDMSAPQHSVMTPVTIEDLPPSHKSHYAHTRDQERERRNGRARWQKIVGRLGWSSLALTLAVSPVRAFQIDQAAAPLVYGDDPVAIEEVASTPCTTPYSEQKLTVLFAGTGEKNPAETYGPAIAEAFREDCMIVAAVKEGAIIFTPETKRLLNQYVVDHGIKIVDTFGRSVGGKEELQWLADLQGAYARNIFLDSTPSDALSTFQLSQNDFSDLSLTADLASLANEANTSGGPFLRTLIELEQRKDQFYDDNGFNPEKFMTVLRTVAREKLNQNAVSNEAYLGQVAMTLTNSAPDDIAAIASANEGAHPLPCIYYFAPDHDQIVKGPRAIADFSAIAKQHNIPFTVMTIHNADHAQPLVYADQYSLAIKNAKDQTSKYNGVFYVDQILGTSSLWLDAQYQAESVPGK